MEERPPALPVRDRSGRWWRARQRIFRSWLESFDSPGAGWWLKTDLFDEASGPFSFGERPHAEGRLLGIDINERVVRLARDRMSRRGIESGLVVADVRRLPLADETMHSVVSLSTLDHFYSQDDIFISLQELGRILQVQGRLFLLLDNPRNPEVALRRWLPDTLVRALRADRFFLGELVGAAKGSAMLKAAGFEVQELGYLVHALRYPAIRLLNFLDSVKLNGLGRAIERFVVASEFLAHLPSRSFTGHYVSWIAVRKPP